MLCELHLRNLAVAEAVSLRLAPGLNALTGSTGAGKSLVVEAVRWLRGEAIDRGVLRAGAESASAEAVFDLGARPELVGRLADCGVELADDAVLRIRREVRAAGRSRAWVNGRMASAALLAEIGEVLIQTQEQHLQLGLLDARRHVDALDALGVDSALVEAWTDARSEWLAVHEELRAWTAQRDRLMEQRDLLEYQWRELDAAGLVGAETDPLRRSVAMMEGGAQLVEHGQLALDRLQDEEGGAAVTLGAALGQLGRLPEDLPDLASIRDALESAAELVQEATRELERFLADADIDPAAFQEAQSRLATLQELSRKYARTEAELVRLRDRLREQLDGLATDGALPETLRERDTAASARLDAAGRALHASRKATARRAVAEARKMLADLGMPGAELEFEFVPEADPDSPVRIDGRRVHPVRRGPCRVVLLARTNPGEPFSPVDRGASGGELARIALVLRSLSLRGQAPALLLLDEVDAGIGADLGPAVARRLRALAEAGQLLVISHQPRIAAAADRHLVALKDPDSGAGRTTSAVEVLDRAGRIDEMVRMLGSDSPEARQVATSLLEAEGAG